MCDSVFLLIYVLYAHCIRKPLPCDRLRMLQTSRVFAQSSLFAKLIFSKIRAQPARLRRADGTVCKINIHHFKQHNGPSKRWIVCVTSGFFFLRGESSIEFLISTSCGYSSNTLLFSILNNSGNSCCTLNGFRVQCMCVYSES